MNNRSIKRNLLADFVFHKAPDLGSDKNSEPRTPITPKNSSLIFDDLGFEFAATEPGSDAEQSPQVTPFSSPNPRKRNESRDNKEEAEHHYQQLLQRICQSTPVKALSGISKEALHSGMKDRLTALLGQVNFDHPGFLFHNKNPELDKITHSFLPAFYKKHEKLLLRIQKNKGQDTHFKMPGCISFALLQTDNTKSCLISISRSANPKDDEKLAQALQSFVEDFNLNSSISCEVIMHCNPAHHQLIEEVSSSMGQGKAVNTQRLCAEKPLTRELAKLMYRNPRLIVTALDNFAFYPYQTKTHYPTKGNSVAPPLSKNGKWSTQAEEYILHHWPCCKSCQANSAAYFGILAAVKTEALEEVEKAKQTYGVPLTPATRKYRSYELGEFLSPAKTKSGTESKENSPARNIRSSTQDEAPPSPFLSSLVASPCKEKNSPQRAITAVKRPPKISRKILFGAGLFDLQPRKNVLVSPPKLEEITKDTDSVETRETLDSRSKPQRPF